VNELTTTNFVQPHFIEELGEDGLWDDEIALSLGASPHHLRKKLRIRGYQKLAPLPKQRLLR
jgi:hypothetical protein